MANYHEIGDYEVRDPEKIQEVYEEAVKLAKGDSEFGQEFGVYYLGVADALRWVLCATTIKPLPFEREEHK